MVKLLEYEAKSLLKTAGVPVPKSFIAATKPDFLPVVVKSQVPIGGRGKSGGIVVAKTDDEYTAAIGKLMRLNIRGFIPKMLLAEELVDIERELYLSLVIDKPSASIVLMAHRNGGVEIEENDPDSFLKIPLDGKNSEPAGEQLADYYDTPGLSFFLQDTVERLYGLFVSQDVTLLEINPLILTKSSSLVAGDAKIILDDASVFRHGDWKFEAEKAEVNFVTLNDSGNVATIANGAGLAMATVDAVADIGLEPANFLDIGGGANEASVLAAFNRIMDYPNINVIIINIFAGITRCDEVAKAIISARSQIVGLPPLAIRLAGTNYEQAATMLADENIIIHQDLESALAAAKESV